ncbi:MAG: hypothetical protein D3903_01775 [Candidatus Electrothrix sp. GM3_4]|nr:hypothetical protein [Candidatus Electrothrix sp. GM3_4]
MIEESNNVAEKIRTAIFWVGVVLIVAGGIALLALATVAVEIINVPEGVALVKWLAEKVGESGLYLHGCFAPSQFALKISPAPQYIFLGIIGLLIVNIFAAIMGRLLGIRLGVGAELMQFAGIQKTDKPVAKDTSVMN